MASESPTSKKRKILQPTIKCFMNLKPPKSENAETAPDAKPSVGRSRCGPRVKPQKGVFRDQPPIQIFMSSPSSANAQKENDSSPNKTATASSRFAQDVSEPNLDRDKTEDLSSKTDQAAKLDIKLSPEILLFMKSVCLRQPASRAQADLTLHKMILDFNPNLRKSDEPLVWLRMQKSLSQMAVRVQEEMAELQRQREAAAIAAAAAARAAATARAAQEAERLRFLNHVRMQAQDSWAAMNRNLQSSRERLKQEHERLERQRRDQERRENERRERERREQMYNQKLYDTVHRVSSATNLVSTAQQLESSPIRAEQQTITEAQWDNLRQTVLRQIGINDKDAATLVRFIYKNFPPKGKIRVTDEAIGQMAQLQLRNHEPDSKKKLKMFLLKVIQDYHPDKVNEELGDKWKTISEEIAKRVTKYYEGLK